MINIRFEKKRKLTKIQIFVELHGRLISPKFLNLFEKKYKSEGKTFLQVIKPHVIINNEFIKSYENFFFQNFSFIR